MEYIDMLEVIETCSQYLQDPSNLENQEAFEELKKKIVVRSYLALREKEIVVGKVLKDIKVLDNNSQSYMSALELATTFDALFAYTNVDSEIIDAMKDPDFYDLLWASGLCDYIIEFCKEDYNRIIDIIHLSVSAENLFVLIEEMKNLDTKSLEDLTDEFKRFRLETKPESLIALGNIAAKGDPILNALKSAVEETAEKQLSEKE